MPSAFVNAGGKDDVSKEKYESKGASAGGDGDQSMAGAEFSFEILMSMQEGEKWIYNHFIQLRGTHYINREWNKTDSSVTFYPYAIHYLAPNMFDLCPFIDKYVLPRSFVFGLFSKFHSFVISAIEEGFYISTFLDQFFAMICTEIMDIIILHLFMGTMMLQNVFILPITLKMGSMPKTDIV